jgi:hypothetical protein
VCRKRIGETSLGLETAERSRTDLHPFDGMQTKTKALADAGITTSTANRYEQIADLYQGPGYNFDRPRH